MTRNKKKHEKCLLPPGEAKALVLLSIFHDMTLIFHESSFVLFSITIFLEIFGHYSPKFLSCIFLRYLSGKSTCNESLKTLQSELKAVSALDEFAKYARLQRKLAALNEELLAHKNENNQKRKTIDFTLSFLFTLLQNFIYLAIIYFYRSTPIFRFPSDFFYISP
eukprot:Sdes_comp20800_c0_seq1m17098